MTRAGFRCLRITAIEPHPAAARAASGSVQPPATKEEWTLSITHTDEAVDRYVEVFDEMAREITES